MCERETASTRAPSPTSLLNPIKQKKKLGIFLNITGCSYSVVQDAATAKGWMVLCQDSEDGSKEVEFDVLWQDRSVTTQRVRELRTYQRINHFPGMNAIARKNGLATKLLLMQGVFPEEYNFFPKTWVLPRDLTDFKNQFAKNGFSNKTYIIKPDAGCQGQGIYLTRNLTDVDAYEKQVAQKYLSKPFLIDGFKFDLRIYVLVLSCDPLSIYLYEDGLVRLCTEKYVKPSSNNMSKTCMHLTNYAINKHNEKFEMDSEGRKEEDGKEGGSKRSLKWFKRHLTGLGYDVNVLWREITDVIIKTIIPVQAQLAHTYRSCFPKSKGESSACFELLGFDIMIDKNIKPWLIEVNHSPSFSTDSQLDYDIKLNLIKATLSMLNVSSRDRKNYKALTSGESKRRLYGASNNEQEGIGMKKFKEKITNRMAKRERINKSFERIYPKNTDADANYEKLFAAAFSFFDLPTSSCRSLLSSHHLSFSNHHHPPPSPMSTTSAHSNEESLISLDTSTSARERRISTSASSSRERKDKEKIELPICGQLKSSPSPAPPLYSSTRPSFSSQSRRERKIKIER